MLRRSTERYGGSARTARRTNGVVTLVPQHIPFMFVGLAPMWQTCMLQSSSMASADEGHLPFQRSCTHCQGSTPAPQAVHTFAWTAPGTAHRRKRSNFFCSDVRASASGHLTSEVAAVQTCSTLACLHAINQLLLGLFDFCLCGGAQEREDWHLVGPRLREQLHLQDGLRIGRWVCSMHAPPSLTNTDGVVCAPWSAAGGHQAAAAVPRTGSAGPGTPRWGCSRSEQRHHLQCHTQCGVVIKLQRQQQQIIAVLAASECIPISTGTLPKWSFRAALWYKLVNSYTRNNSSQHGGSSIKGRHTSVQSVAGFTNLRAVGKIHFDSLVFDTLLLQSNPHPA